MAEAQDPALTSAADRSPERIRADIERTRARLDGTIDELEDRLSPPRLADGAWTRARETAREGAAAAVEVVRSNPVPVALVAAGLGWWIVEAVRSRGRRDALAGEAVETAYTPSVSSCRARAEAARLRRESTAAGAGARVAGARQRFWELLDAQPLAAGAAATGLGLLAGVASPKTRLERERIGPWRDGALDRAQRAAIEASQAAAAAAREIAAREDLTPTGLGRRARHVAEESVSAAGSAVRRRLGSEPRKFEGN